MKCKFATKSILQLSFLLLLTACAQYKIPTACIDDTPCHPLYQAIPRHRCLVQWYDLGHWTSWMIFGNDDDGIFGENRLPPYYPDEPICTWKAVKWTCRNPLHNFCYYVIGSADRVNSEFALIKCNRRKLSLFTYRPEPVPGFEEEPSFFLGFHGWKPCFSLHLFYNAKYRGQFYLGWRERGNFGIKFLPIAKRCNF